MATKIVGIVYDDVSVNVLGRLRDITPYADWETIHMLCADAADEIVRLRIAGDLLLAALRVETVNGQMAVCDGTDEAFQAWREARLSDRSESTVWTKPVGNPAQQNGMCVDNPEEARREL
jgi:hypothetical protein